MGKLTLAACAALLAAFLASFGPSPWSQPPGTSLASVSPHDLTMTGPDLPVIAAPDAF
jgi:hypothetical protein